MFAVGQDGEVIGGLGADVANEGSLDFPVAPCRIEHAGNGRK